MCWAIDYICLSACLIACIFVLILKYVTVSIQLTRMIVATISPQVRVGYKTLQTWPVNCWSCKLQLLPNGTHPRSSSHVTHGHPHSWGQSGQTGSRTCSRCTCIDHRGRGSHGGSKGLWRSAKNMVDSMRICCGWGCRTVGNGWWVHTLRKTAGWE